MAGHQIAWVEGHRLVWLRSYIDYEAIARDMGYNGEIEEIEREMIVTNAYEF
jgi:hypothetical protein